MTETAWDFSQPQAENSKPNPPWPDNSTHGKLAQGLILTMGPTKTLSPLWNWFSRQSPDRQVSVPIFWVIFKHVYKNSARIFIAEITNCCLPSGFSLGQGDEDEDESEAVGNDFVIPSLRDYEKEKEILNARSKRPSHFYGHVTRQDDDASEGNKKLTGIKMRPPKPRWGGSDNDYWGKGR